MNNIKHAVVDELKRNTLTIHKLLEFAPVFYETVDPKDPSKFKKTMRFEPQRNAANPLPSTLKLIIFEESSMISLELYNMLQEALPHEHQEVFLGDIQQLPPIFGLAILGFKMNELTVVELKEVYRQALQSPIITLAWALLDGQPLVFSAKEAISSDYHPILNPQSRPKKIVPALQQFSRSTEEYGTVLFQIWQKNLDKDTACNSMIVQFNHWADTGYYNPEEDIILCPYNKSFGCDEMNRGIANHLGKKRKAIVHEVIAGFQKHYLAVGDRVLYDKEDAFITAIHKNGEYLGSRYQVASEHLDRWGAQIVPLTEEEKLRAQAEEVDNFSLEAIEALMETAAGSVSDRVNSSSHIIHLRLCSSADDADDIIIDQAGQVNALIGGYAISVHKSQGSEYEKVFIVLHAEHAKMVSRELLYTAVTRARKYLHIICEPATFYKGIQSQQIKGNTLAEKSQFFMGKGDPNEILAEQKRLREEKLAKLRAQNEVLNAAKDMYEQAGTILNRSKYNGTGSNVNASRNSTIIDAEFSVVSDTQYLHHDTGSAPIQKPTVEKFKHQERG